MNKRNLRLILLHHSPRMTRPLLKLLYKYDPSFLFPFKSSASELAEAMNIPVERAKAVIDHISDTNIMKKLVYYQKMCHILTLFDEEYPDALRTIPDPPFVLYCQGDPGLLSSPDSISVIGTRKPSPYAFPAMKKVLLPLISSGFTLVSGMAVGVDQYAHFLADEYGGKTVAVLGSGFQHIYPKNNLPLYEQLAREHAVLSEYPPDRPPKKYHFPERNRIISGLTPATFVIEARDKSGTLITVDQALEQGKDVYALPGPAGSPTSEGCHQLINDGAKLVHTYQDIIEEW